MPTRASPLIRVRALCDCRSRFPGRRVRSTDQRRTSLGPYVENLVEESSYAVVETMADWSPWVPFDIGAITAPRLPGVYMAREGPDGPIVYVGMAGERAGSGKPKGLWGRLGVYGSGKGMVSELGEAASDRALADPDWRRETPRRGRGGRLPSGSARTASGTRSSPAHLTRGLPFETSRRRPAMLIPHDHAVRPGQGVARPPRHVHRGDPSWPAPPGDRQNGDTVHW
jgi:hypothetical protein